MRTGSRGHRGTSTPPARGRRRPVRRLLPAPDSGPRRCASTWRRCAPLRAGTGDRSAQSHADLHDGAHFHRAVSLEDRTSLRELHRLSEVAGLDQRVPTHDVLGLRKGPVGHALLPALHQLSGALERLPLVLDMALLAELLQPGHPFLHRLLHPFGGSVGLAPAIEKQEFAHRRSSFLRYVTCSRLVLVVVPNPSLGALTFLLPAERGEIEEIVRVEGEIEAALVRGVRVEHLIAFAKEDAQARQLPFREPDLPAREQVLRGGVVVLVLALLRVEGDPEVVVEVVAERGEPREVPSHALPERLDLLKGRAGDGREGRVARAQV